MLKRLLCLFFCSAGIAFGQEPSPVTTIGGFWAHVNDAGQGEFPVRAELVVHYYDETWGMMWAEWDGIGIYIQAPSHSLSIRAGQRILLEGFAGADANRFDWSRTTIEVLEEDAGAEPLILEGEIDNIEDFWLRLVRTSGLVVGQRLDDERHLLLNLISHERSMTVRLPVDEHEAIPQLKHSFARLTGVLTVQEQAGHEVFDLWVRGLGGIEVVGRLYDDPRFEVPVTPVDMLAGKKPNERVRVEGWVHGSEPGASVTVRDGTGQVKLLTRQTEPLEAGVRIEAIGFPDTEGVEVVLQRSFYRLVEGGEASIGQKWAKLRLTEQARVLEVEEAEAGYPVQLAGMVTWSNEEKRSFFLNDASGGIRVSLPDDASIPIPQPMSWVEVSGSTRMDGFVTAVEAVAVATSHGLGEPSPRVLTLDQAMTGAEYGQWIELRGYVHSMAREGALTRLQLTTASGDFSALVAADSLSDDLVGAVVRVRGVCDAIVNERRQLVGICLNVPMAEFIEVEEPALEDVFDTPSRSIGSLFRFNAARQLTRRVQISGVVLLHRPGRALYVQDGEDSILVLARQTEELEPGDLVDVVGFPGRESGRLLMREAIYRRVGSGAEPVPSRLTDLSLVDVDLDGRAVRVVGTLLDVIQGDRALRLQIQRNDRIFQARLPIAGQSDRNLFAEVGGLLELTGIYHVELDEYRQPRSFVLALRTMEDIDVLRAASIWTPARVGAAMVLLFLIVLLALFWAVWLRQRNRLLRQAHLDLEEVNNELESRVEQRTAALDLAREELAREHGRLQFVFDSVPMGISLSLVKPDGTLTRLINEGQWQICGLGHDRGDDFDFFKITHPDDYSTQAKLQGQLTNGEIDDYSLEKRYVRPDGEIVWVSFMVQRRRFSDGTLEDLSTVVDITELKRSQEEAAYERDLLRTLLDHCPDYIYFKDQESRFIMTSKSHAECVGADSPDEMVGKNDFDYFTEAHSKVAFADEREIMRSGKPMIGKVEEETHRNPGGESWMLTTKMPFRNQDGEIIGTFGVSRDITLIKKAEMELENTHRRLLEVSRQAGMAEVATSVLHNVGNVLNSVNISASMVDEQVRRSKASSIGKLSALVNKHADDLGAFFTEDPQGRQVPGFLASLAERLATEQKEVLEELKSLRSKIDHIKEIVAMQQNYAKVSGVAEKLLVVDLIEDALSINAAAFVRHGVEIVRDFQANPVITIDRHKILQILVNVLGNAKQACFDSGQREKTVIIRVTEDDDRIQIGITDNGIGISPENMPQIFSHGFTTRKEGHGFGLHSGALAIKELGGVLKVESEGLKKGATFLFDLPLCPPEEA